jgi:hypothetical protein
MSYAVLLAVLSTLSSEKCSVNGVRNTRDFIFLMTDFAYLSWKGPPLPLKQKIRNKITSSKKYQPVCSGMHIFLLSILLALYAFHNYSLWFRHQSSITTLLQHAKRLWAYIKQSFQGTIKVNISCHDFQLQSQKVVIRQVWGITTQEISQPMLAMRKWL